MNLCIRFKILEDDTDNKTCESCIQYIGGVLKCQRCNCNYTRTNRTRHYRSYKCRVSIFLEKENKYIYIYIDKYGTIIY